MLVRRAGQEAGCSGSPIVPCSPASTQLLITMMIRLTHYPAPTPTPAGDLHTCACTPPTPKRVC